MSDNVFKFERRIPLPPPDDFDTERALEVCKEMLKSIPEVRNMYLEAACATQLFIHLHDLAQRARVIGSEMTFSDDIDPLPGVTTITDLISKLRNAVCHIRSSSRNLNHGSFVFNRIQGYLPNAIEVDGISCGCDYPDDMAIYFGPYRFYIKRHGHRALRELRVIFAGQGKN